ncbi:MAG TPA: hypothetical protein VH207_03400 [Chthoniobacterales bacterium]|nr:hypothetical protein [Chthoniobacterales bacterium]
MLQIKDRATRAVNYVGSNGAWDQFLPAIKQAADKVRNVKTKKSTPPPAPGEPPVKPRMTGQQSFGDIDGLFEKLLEAVKLVPRFAPPPESLIPDRDPHDAANQLSRREQERRDRRRRHDQSRAHPQSHLRRREGFAPQEDDSDQESRPQPIRPKQRRVRAGQGDQDLGRAQESRKAGSGTGKVAEALTGDKSPASFSCVLAFLSRIRPERSSSNGGASFLARGSEKARA